jgi:hypothetical protein
MSQEKTQDFIKKKMMIELINREMDQIESERKRPGWTNWALLGALTTLFWAFVKELPFKYINWQNVGLLFFTLSMTIECVRSFPLKPTTQNGGTPKEPRFLISPFFGHVRVSLLMSLIQASLLLYISIHLKQDIMILAKISTWILLGVIILAIIGAIILSYCKFPYPNFQKRKLSTWTLIILSALLIVSLFGYWNVLVHDISILEASDLKIAMMLMLVTYVFVLLADLQISSPILPSLISIRRDLALDKIDIDSATRQLDIAFSGMKVEDLLQENVKEILDYLDAANRIWIEMTHSFKTIESFIPAVPSDLIKAEFSRNLEAIKALIHVNKKHSTNLNDIQNKLKDKIIIYTKLAMRIESMDIRAANAITEVTNKIDAAQIETNKLSADAEEQIAKVEAKIDIV